MIISDVPYATLRKLLLDLGFVEKIVPGSHIIFGHAASKTVFVFRLYQPKDKVNLMDLVGVRKQLDWRGLLSEHAFDASLRKASA
jgi:predicted RNA binding protein YcfA (HicA-like mRNA interferase family)